MGAHHTDVEFAPLDVSLDEGSGPDMVMDEGHPFAQLLIVVHDRRLRNPQGRFLCDGFHDQRKDDARVAAPSDATAPP